MGGGVRVWRAEAARARVAPAAKTGRGRAGPRAGVPGEDVATSPDGTKRLRLPARFPPGSVKATAWTVLAAPGVGPAGLPVRDIVRLTAPLRDWSHNKTPETTLAGAMDKDGLFERVAPPKDGVGARYALTALTRARAGDAPAPADPAAEREPTPAPSGTGGSSSDEGGGSDGSDTDESDAGAAPRGPRRGGAHAPWCARLAADGYDALPLGDRVAALDALSHAALEGPSFRAALDARVEEGVRAAREAADAKKAASRGGSAAPGSRAASADRTPPPAPLTAPQIQARLLAATTANTVRAEPLGTDRGRGRWWAPGRGGGAGPEGAPSNPGRGRLLYEPAGVEGENAPPPPPPAAVLDGGALDAVIGGCDARGSREHALCRALTAAAPLPQSGHAGCSPGCRHPGPGRPGGRGRLVWGARDRRRPGQGAPPRRGRRAAR